MKTKIVGCSYEITTDYVNVYDWKDCKPKLISSGVFNCDSIVFEVEFYTQLGKLTLPVEVRPGE
jgi:hypothetical protein